MRDYGGTISCAPVAFVCSGVCLLAVVGAGMLSACLVVVLGACVSISRRLFVAAELRCLVFQLESCGASPHRYLLLSGVTPLSGVLHQLGSINLVKSAKCSRQNSIFG